MGRERHGGDLDRHIFPAQFDDKLGAGGREGWRHIADGDRTTDRRSKAARTDDADWFAGYALRTAPSRTGERPWGIKPTRVRDVPPAISL